MPSYRGAAYTLKTPQDFLSFLPNMKTRTFTNLALTVLAVALSSNSAIASTYTYRLAAPGVVAPPTPPSVTKIAPTLGAFVPGSKTMGNSAFVLTAPTSNSGGAISYSSSDTSVATVSGSTVTLVGSGTTTITATQAANGNYTQASVTGTLSVAPAPSPTNSAWDTVFSQSMSMSFTGLTVAGTGASGKWELARANTAKSTGKYVFEMKTSSNSAYVSCGMADVSTTSTKLGSNATSFGISGNGSLAQHGMASFPATPGGCATATMFAVDFDAGKGWIAQGGVWQGGGNPATGTTPSFTFAANTPLYPAASINTGYTYSVTANFGATSFTNGVPVGFTAGWY